MTSKPWMPLYIADYLADTSHLGAYESGAYLHLIMHQWQCGALPADERALARIARVRSSDWPRIREVLAPFFGNPPRGGVWIQKRTALELRRAGEISNKRKDAALQKHSKCKANALHLHTQSQSQSHGGGGERAALIASPVASSSSISQEAFSLSATIARLCGHDEAFIPPAWAGAPLTVQGWLNKGWTAEQIEPACREIMAAGPYIDPPAKITYFEKGIARFVARLAQPLPTTTPTGGHRERHLTPHQQRIIDRDAAIARLRQCARDQGAGGGDDGGSEAARDQC
jgi:uncharacterized protein YdaU (DUF1376 family)